MKIKEGGVMDINKERELFLAHMRSIGSARFMFELDEDGNFDDMSMAYAWSAWQAAKAQQALHDRLLVKSIREHVERHISEISVNDSFDKGWLAAMKCIQNNIDMLESKEPK